MKISGKHSYKELKISSWLLNSLKQSNYPFTIEYTVQFLFNTCLQFMTQHIKYNTKYLAFQEYNHHKAHTKTHTLSFIHLSRIFNQEFTKRMDAIKKYRSFHLLIKNTKLLIVSLFLSGKLCSAFLIEIKTKTSPSPNKN